VQVLPPRFEFIDCLGRGGFGEVYRARMHTSSGVQRLVAVKVLHERARDVPSAIRRLRDEAHLLAALHHRSIVQVLDLVEIQERLALVTEYIEGADLDQVLREDTRLPATVALELVGEVASALHAAWSAAAPQTTTPMRLVHRDIKPANLRITPEGSVKLLDFGIARSPEIDREARTTTGIVVGTVGYFSPERLTEDIPQPTDDVYALGCVLFEALTGERLYRDMMRSDLFRLAFHPSVHAEFIGKRLDAATELRAVTPATRALLARLLASEPKQRPSAGELESACFDIVRQMEGPSLRAWARARRWTHQEPAARGVFDGQVLEARALPDPEPPPHATTAPERPAPEAVTQADPPSPPRPTLRPRPRPAPAPEAAEPGGRRWIWIPVVLLAAAGGMWWMDSNQRDPVVTSRLGADNVDVALETGPDGTRLLRPSQDPTPQGDDPEDDLGTDVPADESVPRLPPAPDAQPPAPLPASLDGDHLLTLRRGQLELRDLDSPARTPRRLATPQGKVADLCIRGDVLALAMGALVEVRQVADDTVVDRMRPGGSTVDRVLCLDDGHIAAVSKAPRRGSGGGTGEIVWWDTQGRVKGRLLPPAGVVDAASMGDRILVLDGEGGVRTWEGKGGPIADMVPLPTAPLGVTPSLGGPGWVASATQVCSVEGTCVEVDARRGLLTSGVGWVAVGGPDRITVLDATKGAVIRELSAEPAALFARTDGTLAIVEPDGLRIIDPVADKVLATRPW